MACHYGPISFKHTYLPGIDSVGPAKMQILRSPGLKPLINPRLMMRPTSSFACGLVGLLLSDVASAFTAPLAGALIIANGRSPVTMSAQNVDASSSRSDFLKTSYATIAAITTTALFAPSIVFAAEDAVDDLSMPTVEETKVSEVSRMQWTAIY